MKVAQALYTLVAEYVQLPAVKRLVVFLVATRSFFELL